MSFLIFILAVAALLVALKALRDSRPRPGQPTPAERIAGLEERVRDLLYRVWTLEQQRGGVQPQPEAPPAPAPTAPPPPPRRGSTSSSVSAPAGPPGSAWSPSSSPPPSS